MSPDDTDAQRRTPLLRGAELAGAFDHSVVTRWSADSAQPRSTGDEENPR
ncbi:MULTISPECIES: hypothetical protein [Streptomyces]|nr:MULTISPECIES: hypothetical protein [Streptomyces]MCH0556898.1 hypothetical protein [Streptomyces sp. MUM 16J]